VIAPPPLKKEGPNKKGGPKGSPPQKKGERKLYNAAKIPPNVPLKPLRGRAPHESTKKGWKPPPNGEKDPKVAWENHNRAFGHKKVGKGSLRWDISQDNAPFGQMPMSPLYLYLGLL